MTVRYHIMANIQTDNLKKPKYAEVWVKNRWAWKTKRIAEKHAREYKALHNRDAWVQEVDQVEFDKLED